MTVSVSYPYQEGAKVVGATGFEPATPNPPEKRIGLSH